MNAKNEEKDLMIGLFWGVTLCAPIWLVIMYFILH